MDGGIYLTSAKVGSWHSAVAAHGACVESGINGDGSSCISDGHAFAGIAAVIARGDINAGGEGTDVRGSSFSLHARAKEVQRPKVEGVKSEKCLLHSATVCLVAMVLDDLP